MLMNIFEYLSFSPLPFTLAQNLQLATLPVGLRVSRPFQIRTV